ncbi:MAG: secretin and TonB N-terminal domain-containing protein [Candidatus Omnitrophica bacterium]|nr:secretin and TonB N-terminal domain-containing protein [Candidatus Omnitrophota bacterium]
MKRYGAFGLCLLLCLNPLPQSFAQSIDVIPQTQGTAAPISGEAELTSEDMAGDAQFTDYVEDEIAQQRSLEEKFQQKIDLDYKDADIVNVLRSLAFMHNLNIVMGPGVKGDVTLSLQNVTLKEALEAVLATNGLVYSLRNDVVYVAKGDPEAVEMQSEVIFLKYISSSEAQNLLKKSLSSKGDIKINEAANSIVITDTPTHIAKAKALLRKIDLAPQQVIIEAKIVDVTLTDIDALGIKWDVDYAPGKGIFSRNTVTEEQITSSIDLSSKSEDVTGGQINIDTFTLKNVNVSATIDALIKNGKATILASPSIAVVNGQEARIVIGERYPYKERTQTPTGTTETTKFVDIGVTLRVTPHINDDGYITMRLHPEVSSLQSALDAGPRITTREADTTVRVKGGETLVIGGLIQQQEQINNEKVPVLGSIPLIKHLFSRRNSKIEQKELAVFITPTIIYPFEERQSIDNEDPLIAFNDAQNNLIERIYEKAQALEHRFEILKAPKDRTYRSMQILNLYEYIYSEFPESYRAPEALYRSGMIYYHNLNDKEKSKMVLSRLLEQYPHTIFAEKATPLFRQITFDELTGPRHMDLNSIFTTESP